MGTERERVRERDRAGVTGGYVRRRCAGRRWMERGDERGT